MKVIFDDGSELEIKESTFYDIVVRAKEYSDSCNKTFFGEYLKFRGKSEDNARMYWNWSNEELVICNICKLIIDGFLR